MSLPKTIQRPDAPLYSTQFLELFPEYTYESWKAENGGKEPPFDPTYPSQYHADDRFLGLPAATPVTYTVLDAANRKLVPFTTTAGRASTVNIPSPHGLPQTNIAIPTPWDSITAAQACAAVIGGSVIDLAQTWDTSIFGPINSAIRYAISFPGQKQGQLLYAVSLAPHLTNDTASGLQAYFNELGLKLDVLTAEQAAAKAYAADAALPRVPVPMAALLPNETLVPGTTPGTVLVQRTDLPPAINNAPAGDGFTAQDRADLQAIKAAVVKG